MDVTAYLDLNIAPRAVFDNIEERRTRPRFMLPTGDGDWRSVTWGAFADQIRAASLFLSSAGLKYGERAIVFAPNRVEWMSAALGIQAAGGVMVPMYPNSTAELVGYVVEHSDSRFIFVDTPALLSRVFEAWDQCEDIVNVVLLDDELDPVKVLAHAREQGVDVPTYPAVHRKLLTWSQVMAIGEAVDAENPDLFEQNMDGVSLDQPGLMLYTSGTTGRPKGVPLTHRNVASNGRDWLQCNAPLVEEGDVDLLWLPMSHIFGFGEACLGNMLGWTSYMSDPGRALGDLPTVRPHVFMSVPRYYEKLAHRAIEVGPDLETRREALQSATGGNLRFCLSGGAGLKREVKTLFQECGLLIIEGYGLTEASPTLTLNRPDAYRFDAVGKPLPSVEIRLAEDGEILAKGPNIFSGYHKDADASQEAFTSDGWLKTGDIGRFTDDGFLQIIDRKKEILVTAGGKNVPPANIEMRFADDPYIAHVVVYGDGEPYLVAGIWLNEEAVNAYLSEHGVSNGGREEAIRSLVQSRVDRANSDLARYMTIKKFHLMPTPLTVDNGLLTTTLKVRRKKVYDTFRNQFEGLYAR